MHTNNVAGAQRSGLTFIIVIVLMAFIALMSISCGGGGGFTPDPTPDPLPTQGNWPTIPAGAKVAGRHGLVTLTGGMPIEMIVYEDNVPINANGSHLLEVPTGSHTAIDYDIFAHVPTAWTEGGASVGGWRTILATDFQREGGEFFFQPTFTYSNDDLQRSSDAEFARLLQYSTILANRDMSVPLKSGMRLCGDVLYEVHISQNSFADMILLRVLPPRPAPPQNPGGGGGNGGGWEFSGLALFMAFAFFEPQDGGTIEACTTYQEREPGTPVTPTPDTDIDLTAPDTAAPGAKFTVSVTNNCPSGWVLRNGAGNIVASGTGNKSGIEITMTATAMVLTVTDGCGNTDSETVNPTATQPDNLKPSVSLVANPQTSTVANATAKKTVELKAIAQDADGTIVKVEFDRDGDGTFEHVATITPAAMVEVIINYDYAVGVHHPSVRATDNDGETATTSVTVTVTVDDGNPNPEGELGYNIADDTKPVGDGDELNVSAEVFRLNPQGERIKQYQVSELTSSILEMSNGTPADSWSYSTTGKIYSALDANLDGNFEDELPPGEYSWHMTFSDGTEIWIPLTFLSKGSSFLRRVSDLLHGYSDKLEDWAGWSFVPKRVDGVRH